MKSSPDEVSYARMHGASDRVATTLLEAEGEHPFPELFEERCMRASLTPLPGKNHVCDRCTAKKTAATGAWDTNVTTADRISRGESAAWRVRLICPRRGCVMVGVAPTDAIEDGMRNAYTRGWFLKCKNGTLWSGPPHSYYNVASPTPGPERPHVQKYVDIRLDMHAGTLSFAMDGSDAEIGYDGIPVDATLSPAVLMIDPGTTVAFEPISLG